jgi:hypothetical protein
MKTTWTAADGSLWAKDILLPFIPNLRVFSFGYSGTPKSISNDVTVLDVATDLLGFLTDKREKPSVRNRPLIWAGHNLGGSIIKEALLMGSSRANVDHHNIYSSTVGVVSGYWRTPGGQ